MCMWAPDWTRIKSGPLTPRKIAEVRGEMVEVIGEKVELKGER